VLGSIEKALVLLGEDRGLSFFKEIFAGKEERTPAIGTFSALDGLIAVVFAKELGAWRNDHKRRHRALLDLTPKKKKAPRGGGSGLVTL
jgi:hypothetical protein